MHILYTLVDKTGRTSENGLPGTSAQAVHCNGMEMYPWKFEHDQVDLHILCYWKNLYTKSNPSSGPSNTNSMFYA